MSNKIYQDFNLDPAVLEEVNNTIKKLDALCHKHQLPIVCEVVTACNGTEVRGTRSIGGRDGGLHDEYLMVAHIIDDQIYVGDIDPMRSASIMTKAIGMHLMTKAAMSIPKSENSSIN